MLTGDYAHWDAYICWVVRAVNLHHNSASRSSPFSLFFARAANELANYQAAEHGVVTPEMLMARHKRITELVYPEVALRSMLNLTRMLLLSTGDTLGWHRPLRGRPCTYWICLM